jgi:hypothetical protein
MYLKNRGPELKPGKAVKKSFPKIANLGADM